MADRSRLWTPNGVEGRVGLGAGHDITQWMVNVFWSVSCSFFAFLVPDAFCSLIFAFGAIS